MMWLEAAMRRGGSVAGSYELGDVLDQLIADTLAGSVAYVWPFFGDNDW